MKIYTLHRTPDEGATSTGQTFLGLAYLSKQNAVDAAQHMMQQDPGVFVWVDTAWVLDDPEDN